jgi:hypothetical protein
MLYTKNGSYPATIPFRIKLSDGRTRTDPTSFTSEEISDAGYIEVEDPPAVSSTQVLEWINSSWVIRNKTEQELLEELNAKWKGIRNQRDEMLSNLDWKFLRHQSQIRLGLTPTDDIVALDTYAQALRDVTLQPDPDNVVWPVLE